MTASSPYYGDSAVMRTPPPDLPSLLLKERIVYLGLPLFSDDDAKRQLGMDVTELIIPNFFFWNLIIQKNLFISISTQLEQVGIPVMQLDLKQKPLLFAIRSGM